MASTNEVTAFGYFFENIRVINCTATDELIVPQTSSADNSNKAASTSFVANALNQLTNDLFNDNNAWSGTNTFENQVHIATTNISNNPSFSVNDGPSKNSLLVVTNPTSGAYNPMTPAGAVSLIASETDGTPNTSSLFLSTNSSTNCGISVTNNSINLSCKTGSATLALTPSGATYNVAIPLTDNSSQVATTAFVQSSRCSNYYITGSYYQGSGLNVNYPSTTFYYYLYVRTNDGIFRTLLSSGFSNPISSSLLTQAPFNYYATAPNTSTPYPFSFSAPISQGAEPALNFSFPWSAFPGYCNLVFGSMDFQVNILLPTANSICANNLAVQWTITTLQSETNRPVFINCQESTFINVYNSTSNTFVTGNKIRVDPGTTIVLTAFPTSYSPAFNNNTDSGWAVTVSYP